MKIIGVAKKFIQVFPSNVAEINIFGQSNRFSQLSFSFLMDTNVFIRFVTLGRMEITAGRMKETRLIRLLLNNICWGVVSNFMKLVSHGAWS